MGGRQRGRYTTDVPKVTPAKSTFLLVASTMQGTKKERKRRGRGSEASRVKKKKITKAKQEMRGRLPVTSPPRLLNCGEQWTREGTHARKTGSGATSKTTRREDRRIVLQVLVVPTVTRSMIRADVGVAIVIQTVSRHLAKANLKSERPFRALSLTPEHRQLRLQWYQARSMWNVTDWQKVVFSGESRFVLGTDNNRVRVWRHPEPFLNGLPGAIFQQDNARPHTARVAQDFLSYFQTLPWPARSPDLSPVEHVCDQLKR
ncbi:transposable element Tc1 transposase [Trichonephila clavipes]|nr:transposable element Tc1 transposase [Trichonephila clavipes]